MGSELTPASFKKQYQALLARSGRTQGNTECVECVACTGCEKCTFCHGSQRLLSCHYCETCEGCIECQHCRNSKSLVGCQHCEASERCNLSSYLILCVGLSRCNYCFGCVGIANADYHILNQRYDRRDYFRILETLPKTLKAAVPARISKPRAPRKTPPTRP